MTALLIACFLLCAQATEVLSFGSAVEGQDSRLFQLRTPLVTHNYQMRLSLEGDAQMYMSDCADVSTVLWMWRSSTSLTLSATELQSQGDYFVLVSCASPCFYRLALTHRWALEVEEGIPQVCVLDPQQSTLLQVSAETTAETVFSLQGEPLPVTITAFEGGNPALLVPISLQSTPFPHIATLPGRKPGRKYWLEVTSSEKTLATALFTRPKSTIQLSSQQVLADLLSPGHHRLYSLNSTAIEAAFQVTVTVLSGTGRIYVKRGGIPSFLPHSFISPLQTFNFLLIPQDYHTYYLRVESDIDFLQYKIAVSGEKKTDLRLLPGEIHYGYIEMDELQGKEAEAGQQLYYFQGNSEQRAQITLRADSGSFNAYLSANTPPTRTQYDCVLREIQANTTSTLYFSTNNRYFLLIESLNSSYSLLFTSEDAISRLPDNTLTNIALNPREMAHFKYFVQRNSTELSVKLLIFRGNVEFYWTFSRDFPMSDAFHMRKYAENSTFSLSTDHNTPNPCFQSSCSLYISLQSVQNSELALEIREIAAISLQYGVKVQGTLSHSDSRLYRASVPGHLCIELLLFPLTGDSDLFIHTDARQIQTVALPTEKQYHHSSVSDGKVQRVRISLNLTESDTVEIAISVYCRSEKCEYGLRAEQESEELANGSPVYGSTGSGELRFYHFYCPYESTNITLRLTLLSGHTPALFVAKDWDFYPNETYYLWVQRDWTQREMVVRSSDPIFIGQSMIGKYQISLLTTNASSYGLTLMLGRDTQVQLFPGRPATGESYEGEVDYFTFESIKSVDIDISVTPLLGSVSIHVNPFLSPLPTAAASTWSTDHSLLPNKVLIAASDPAFCSPCVYLIAVVGCSSEQVFSIVASHRTDVTQLRNGVPVSGELEKGEVRRYLLQVEDLLPVDAALTSYSGNVDLYISDSPTVGAWHSTWNSTETSRTDHIRIPSPPPLLYIAVECVQDSHFSLTLHIRDSYIQLVDGWPVLYTLERSEDDHLFFSFQAAGRPVQCALRPMVRNFFPRVYVTFQPISAQAVKPAAGVAELTFDKREDFENALGELNFRVIKQDSAGKFNIGVYSRMDQPEMAVFSMVCSSHNQPIRLSSGHSGFGTLSKEHFSQTYSIHIPDFSLLEVSVMPCSGRTRLLISSNWTLQDDSEAEVVVTTLSDGRLYGTLVHAKGVYYVKVEMVEESNFVSGASFEIVAYVRTTRRKPQLQSGRDGLLTWKQISGHRFRLQWSPPELDSGESLPHPELVRYRVYYSQEADYPLKTVCGIAVGELNSLVHQPNGHPFSGQTAFILYIPTLKTTSVALVAYVETEEREVAIPYEPLLIHPQARTGFLGWRQVAYALAGLALIACIAGAVVFARYTAVKRKLEFELGEVRGLYQESEL